MKILTEKAIRRMLSEERMKFDKERYMDDSIRDVHLQVCDLQESIIGIKERLDKLEGKEKTTYRPCK